MNFFKKYWIAILIIIVLVISFIIGIFEGLYETKQEPKSLSNYHEELDNEQKPNKPLRNKRELGPPKPKIKITQEKYDKIKSYILSENENEVLTINDLPEQELTEINKIKNSCKHYLDLLNEEQKSIDEYQKKCDDYNKQISQLDPKKNENEIEGFNNMLKRAEDYKKTLEERYKDFENHEKDNILSKLNSLYQITSVEK
uniref:Uncharacterized protein n=1 Tax=Clover phyllody phytoplasma TaxID=35777 RepID=A8QWF1_9MOLU|nr:hypothetical protein [Clover phyllody phytoplasma]